MGTPSSAGEDERTHTQLETIGTPHEPLGLTRPLSVPPLLNRRINAEDAFQNFRPGPGRISAYLAPGGPNTRMDSHIYPGYLVPPNYDSLLGKLIVWAPDRDQAITRMDRALGDTIITGVPTTIPYHKLILDHAEFKKGNVDTGESARTPPLPPMVGHGWPAFLFSSPPSSTDNDDAFARCALSGFIPKYQDELAEEPPSPSDPRKNIVKLAAAKKKKAVA